MRGDEQHVRVPSAPVRSRLSSRHSQSESTFILSALSGSASAQHLFLACCRYTRLRIYEVMTHTSSLLVEVARTASPSAAAATFTGHSLKCLVQVTTPGSVCHRSLAKIALLFSQAEVLCYCQPQIVNTGRKCALASLLPGLLKVHVKAACHSTPGGGGGVS